MEAWRSELYHSAKGTTWSRHTYIAKEKINGKWFYFYSAKDYEMWKKKNSTSSGPTSRIPEKNYKPSLNTASKKTEETKTTKQNAQTSKKSSGSSGSSSSSKKAKVAKSTGGKVKSAKEKKESTSSGSKKTASKEESAKKAISDIVKKTQPTNPVNLNFLKKTFDIQENETKSRSSEDPVALQEEMTKDYEDGSFGYLVLEGSNGTQTFRWQKYNGQVTLKAFDSEAPLTFAQLPKSSSIIDMRVDNKKKK